LILVGLSVGVLTLVEMGAQLSGFIGHSDTMSTAVFAGSSRPVINGIAFNISKQLLPWFGIPAALVILSIFIQRGFVFAPSKLEPKLSRISPISQAKNKFGRSGLFEFAKSFAKLILYSTVLFVFLLDEMPSMLAAMALSPGQVTVALLRLCISLLGIVFVIALSLGVLDFTWQRAEHLRKNRMSRKELTDETKNAEGDPLMRQQRRQKGVAIAMNQMLADVPEADVIIVNPTHYAVALKWDRLSLGAPICVAKGVDVVAAQIREIAKEANVPIHSDPPTARALHATVEIGQEVPRDHYKAVAAAIRFADKIRKAAKS